MVQMKGQRKWLVSQMDRALFPVSVMKSIKMSRMKKVQMSHISRLKVTHMKMVQVSHISWSKGVHTETV
jgi:hypothetical protein